MFRRRWDALPKDAEFESDLEKLGFFVNEDDEIRSISNPKAYFQYRINRNDRINERRGFHMNQAIEKIVHERLIEEGLEKVYLPYPDDGGGGSAKTPIFISKDLAKKSRVVIIVNEPSQDLGILAYRVADGEGGINAGSMVSVVRALQQQKATGSDSSSPGIIITNIGQNLWDTVDQRAITLKAHSSAPLPSLVHQGRQIDSRNWIPHNRDAYDHLDYVLSKVLMKEAKTNCRIDFIAIGLGADELELYLDAHGFETHGRNINTLTTIGGMVCGDSLTDAAYKKFRTQRSRAWVASDAPLGTPLANHYGNPNAKLTFANHKTAAVYSAGVTIIELAFIAAMKPILSWLPEVARPGKAYTHPRVVVTFSDGVQDEIDWDDHINTPAAEKEEAGGVDGGQKKKKKKKKKGKKAAKKSFDSPDTTADETEVTQQECATEKSGEKIEPAAASFAPGLVKQAATAGDTPAKVAAPTAPPIADKDGMKAGNGNGAAEDIANPSVPAVGPIKVAVDPPLLTATRIISQTEQAPPKATFGDAVANTAKTTISAAATSTKTVEQPKITIATNMAGDTPSKLTSASNVRDAGFEDLKAATCANELKSGDLKQVTTGDNVGTEFKRSKKAPMKTRGHDADAKSSASMTNKDFQRRGHNLEERQKMTVGPERGAGVLSSSQLRRVTSRSNVVQPTRASPVHGGDADEPERKKFAASSSSRPAQGHKKSSSDQTGNPSGTPLRPRVSVQKIAEVPVYVNAAPPAVNAWHKKKSSSELGSAASDFPALPANPSVLAATDKHPGFHGKLDAGEVKKSALTSPFPNNADTPSEAGLEEKRKAVLSLKMHRDMGKREKGSNGSKNSVTDDTTPKTKDITDRPSSLKPTAKVEGTGPKISAKALPQHAAGKVFGKDKGKKITTATAPLPGNATQNVKTGISAAVKMPQSTSHGQFKHTLNFLCHEDSVSKGAGFPQKMPKVVPMKSQAPTVNAGVSPPEMAPASVNGLAVPAPTVVVDLNPAPPAKLDFAGQGNVHVSHSSSSGAGSSSRNDLYFSKNAPAIGLSAVQPPVTAPTVITTPAPKIASCLDAPMCPREDTPEKSPFYLYGAESVSAPASVQRPQSVSDASDDSLSVASAPNVVTAQADKCLRVGGLDNNKNGRDISGGSQDTQVPIPMLETDDPNVPKGSYFKPTVEGEDGHMDEETEIFLNNCLDRFVLTGSLMDPREEERIEAEIQDRKDGIFGMY